MNPAGATRRGTWGDWLNRARQQLRDAGRLEPEALAEFALAELLDCRRTELVLHRTEPADDPRRARADAWVARLARGEPLAYVTGWAPFLHYRIRCDRRALSPRPETEELARLVLDCAALGSTPEPAVADIGTGTGCIAIAIAIAHPGAAVFGVDVSFDVLDLARENAAALGATGARWMASDGLRDFGAASLDVIISNAPYVTTGEWAELDASVRDWEPRVALDGGADGLGVIRRIIADTPRVLRPGGRLFLEIGDLQGPAVLALMREAGLRTCAIRKDLFGRERFALAHHEPAAPPPLDEFSRC